MHAKVIIVGSGPAGYTAAIYAARAMLEPVLIAGVQPGGQLTITTDVENYPGFADVIQGPWLMEQMRLQAEHVGTRMVADHIVTVELAHRPFRLIGELGRDLHRRRADHRHRRPGEMAEPAGRAGIQGLRRLGLRHLRRLLLQEPRGGGDRRRQQRRRGGALPHPFRQQGDADPSPRLASVPRRSCSTGSLPIRRSAVIWDTIVEDVLGKVGPPPSVTGVKLRNVHTGAISEIKTDGVFVAIGHAPAVELVADQLRMKPSGYIWTAPNSTQTSIPGVFAAGDVTDEVFRQAVTAAGLGCMAALEAEKFLAMPLETAEAAE